MAVQRALVVVAGRLQNDLRLGPLAVDGLDARFALHLDIADLASLSAILDDPEALLDAAFTGRLAFQVDGTKLAIVDDSLLAIDDATLQFFVAVSSPAGERTLTLGDVVFGLGAAQLTLAGATIENLDLTGRYDAAQQRVSLQGSADTRLPALQDPVLDSTHPSTGTAIRSAFEFEHRPGSTTLDLALDHLYLDPAVNLLELSARDLQLGFRHQNGAWQLKLGGTTCQSWSRLARRMAEAGILRLPRGDDLPDLAGKLDFALSDGGSAFRYRLDMLMPGTGCREGVAPIPFVGPLGPLPVALADSYLAVEFTIDGHGAFHWSFSGGGTLSTTGWLRDPLPLDGLTFGVQARGADDAIPELILTIDGGLPPLRLPPLFPGAGPIEFFQPQTLAVRVGETFAIDGTAAIPNPADIVDELGLPAEWRSLFQPISDLLTGMQASLAVRLPLAGDGPATLGLALEPVNAPRFRLMEALGAVIAAGQSGQVDDGHEFFEVQPGRIEFLAAFAESLSLSLSLSFDCRAFGETFDLTALLRLVDGEREVLLMADLLDPIPFAEGGHSDEGDHSDEEDRSEHGDEDPHFWQDPSRMARAVDLIADQLTEIDGSIDWDARADAYAAELTALDAEIEAMLAGIPEDQRKIVTNHEAFGYFADRYGFEVVGTVIPGGSTLAEPSAGDLADLVREIEEEGVRAIFAENTNPSALAEAVAGELGTEIEVYELYSDSLGEPGSPAETYLGMIRANAQTVASALG